MPFHSDLFGWESVWMGFANSHGGQVLEDGSPDEQAIVAVTAPLEATDAQIVFTPVVYNGKRLMSGTTAMTFYDPADKFAFAIQAERWSDQVGKALGMQDVIVSDHAFDSAFLIQGTDEHRIMDLFADPHLRELILLQPPSQLCILSDPAQFDPGWRIPKGHHAIAYRYQFLMDKLDQLQTAYDVVSSVHQRLAALGTMRGMVAAATASAPEPSTDPPKRLHSPLLDR
jgi:hypothetical protein